MKVFLALMDMGKAIDPLYREMGFRRHQILILRLGRLVVSRPDVI